MKKILFSVMAAVLCIGLIGSAFAYFTDTATSNNNTFTAGTMDIQIWSDSAYTAPLAISATNMEPGVETELYNAYFVNKGSISGYVTVTFGYEDTEDAGSMDADTFAKKLILTEAYLAPWNDADNNVAYVWGAALEGRSDTAPNEDYVSPAAGQYLPTMFGLKKLTLDFYDEDDSTEIVFAPNAYEHETFKLKLAEDADNDYQGEGIVVTMTAQINQTNDSSRP